MNESTRERIESELFAVVDLAHDAERLLAEAAGLLAEAEKAFLQLARPGVSFPPPRR